MATPSKPAGQGAPRRVIVRSAVSLAVIGAVATIVLTLLAQGTRERVARNESSWITQPLYSLLEPKSYDNDLLTDRITMTSRDLLGTSAPATIYRARRNGQPVAAIIQTAAPDGYRGPIELLVAI